MAIKSLSVIDSNNRIVRNDFDNFVFPLSIASDVWDKMNQRRIQLIEIKHHGKISADEQRELDDLQLQSHSLLYEAFPISQKDRELLEKLQNYSGKSHGDIVE